MRNDKDRLVGTFIILTVEKLRDLTSEYRMDLTFDEQSKIINMVFELTSEKFAKFENLSVFKTFSKCVLIYTCNRIASCFEFRGSTDRNKFSRLCDDILEYMDTKDYDTEFRRILNKRKR